MARPTTPQADRAELDAMRSGVSAAAFLEQEGFRLDRAESSRRHQKYRRDSEVIIVTHEGRGWWDAHGSAKGDVFQLVQHLHPGMTLGHVRQQLRPLIGVSPSAEPIAPARPERPDVPIPTQWEARPELRGGSLVWEYLARERALPHEVLRAAAVRDELREGIRGTAWFAHRDADSRLVGADLRGPQYRGFVPGSDKALFQLRTDPVAITRMVVAESPIDAMSFAAMDRHRSGTLYTATSGGMGPGTVEALNGLLGRLAASRDARLVVATDNDKAGHAYASQIAALGELQGMTPGRVVPQGGLKDWNELLQRRAEPAIAPSLTAESFRVGASEIGGPVAPAGSTPMRAQLGRFREALAQQTAGSETAVRSSPSAPATIAAAATSDDPRP